MFDRRHPWGGGFFGLLITTLASAQTPRTSTVSEVRWTDFGWGKDNDRNLAGRFSTRTFNLARLAAEQNYFLRQFDNSVPPRYSGYTTALHLKFPL